MKNFSLKLVSATIIAGNLLFSSCQKEKLVSPVKKDTPVAIQNASPLQQSFKRMHHFLSVLNGSGSFKAENGNSIASCALVSTDSNSMPHVTVIDYGSAGCVGADGISRRGKVMLTFDGDLNEAGTTVITSYHDYFEDNNSFTGNDTVRNDGLSVNGFLSFAFSLNHQIVLADGSGTITEIYTGSYEWISGAETETTDDDIHSYHLIAIISTPDKEHKYSTITPVVKNFAPGCSDYFVEGVLKCEETSTYYIVDYGNGACDNIATWTDPDGQSASFEIE